MTILRVCILQAAVRLPIGAGERHSVSCPALDAAPGRHAFNVSACPHELLRCRLLGTGPGTFTYANATQLAALLLDPSAFTIDNATYTGDRQAAAIVNLTGTGRACSRVWLHAEKAATWGMHALGC